MPLRSPGTKIWATRNNDLAPILTLLPLQPSCGALDFAALYTFQHGLEEARSVTSRVVCTEAAEREKGGL
jgi:hypothetical protein